MMGDLRFRSKEVGLAVPFDLFQGGGVSRSQVIAPCVQWRGGPSSLSALRMQIFLALPDGARTGHGGPPPAAAGVF